MIVTSGPKNAQYWRDKIVHLPIPDIQIRDFVDAGTGGIPIYSPTNAEKASWDWIIGWSPGIIISIIA